MSNTESRPPGKGTDPCPPGGAQTRDVPQPPDPLVYYVIAAVGALIGGIAGALIGVWLRTQG
jgi:hypothetical protein